MVTVWVGWRKGLLYYPLVPDSLTSDDHTHTCTHTHIQHTVTHTHSVVLCVCFRATCLSLSLPVWWATRSGWGLSALSHDLVTAECGRDVDLQQETLTLVDPHLQTWILIRRPWPSETLPVTQHSYWWAAWTGIKPVCLVLNWSNSSDQQHAANDHSHCSFQLINKLEIQVTSCCVWPTIIIYWFISASHIWEAGNWKVFFNDRNSCWSTFCSSTDRLI